MSSQQRITTIVLLNLFGIALFLSWYLQGNNGFWCRIDTDIFYFFNQYIKPDILLTQIIAVTNHRSFDLVSLSAMGLLYLYLFLKQNRAGKKWMLVMGVVMLLTALILNQIGHLIPVVRPSPTNTFENVERVSRLVTISTKDSSSDSFPGDHGLMLIIFAGYMLRYFGRTAFAFGVLFVIIFTLPRIAAGAHWFTDIYVGSLSIACIGLSWFLLTSASDKVIAKLSKAIPFN